MKKILSVLVITAIFTSCKKETFTNPGQPPQVDKKLAQLSWDGDYPGFQKFIYDNKHRLSQVEDDETITTFSFNGNTVVIKAFRLSENRFVSEINAQLDNNGRVISFAGNYSYHVNLPYTDQGILEYNADGYLVKLTRNLSYGLIVVYDRTITDGDLTETRYYENGVLKYTKSAEFYADKSNKLNIGYVEIGSGYNDGLFGKPDKHMIRSAKSQTPGSPNPSWNWSRTYELDSNGYPVSAQHSGTVTFKNYYTYQ